MTDPITTAAALVSGGLIANAGKEILTKLLGPTADYIGQTGKGLVQKADINLSNVFRAAIRKLGPKIDSKGSIHPRVLKSIWEEGRFCDDPIVREYLGGITAATRSEEPDDHGLAFLSAVKQLSHFQMRLHYFLYYYVNQHCRYTLESGEKDSVKDVYTPAAVATSLTKQIYSFPQFKSGDDLLSLAMMILENMRLIGPDYSFIYRGTISDENAMDYLLFTPTPFGYRLFLWAHGIRAWHQPYYPVYTECEPVFDLLPYAGLRSPRDDELLLKGDRNILCGSEDEPVFLSFAKKD